MTCPTPKVGLGWRAIGGFVALLGLLVGLIVVATPAAADPVFSRKVNFQSQFAPVPAGYASDYGLPYDSGRGYGWVVRGTQNPTSMVGSGKDRNRVGDQRLDTLMVVKGASPPQWQQAVSNGTYDVTIAVGDYNLGGLTRAVVEGQLAITDFRSTAVGKFTRITVRVSVTDGFLTLDAAYPPGPKTTNSRWNYVDITQVDVPPHTFTSIDPATGADGVAVTTSVVLTTSDSVDAATIGPDTVQVLTDLGDPVLGNFNTDAAGGVISFTPLTRLAAFTSYSIQTTNGLLGLDGVPFAELTSPFVTGENGVPLSAASFDKVPFDDLAGPTVAKLGPDGRLYVATALGEIRRYDLGADGLPAAPPLVVSTYLYQSTVLGLAFSDSGVPDAPNLWVSRSQLGDETPNFVGTISELSGAALDSSRDVITSLPRSFHDHMNNGIEFGPDGRLYIAQGAMTGYGAPDVYWGNRVETPLSAAILVADVLNDPVFAAPVDVNTDLGYDPSAPGAPLTRYADGTRNPFDMVWHTNGNLYAPVNESAAGTAPAGPGNVPPGLTNVPDGNDFLARVSPGLYYGHPNPSIGHYVLNGGNPTAGADPWEIPQYPEGTTPDPAWQPPLLDFGKHRSVDGITEYTSNQFSGALRGRLLATEFSNGDDVIAIGLDPTGAVSSVSQLASGFNNPLGITSAPSGAIWVTEFGNQPNGDGGKVTLLRPTPGISKTPVARVNFQSETAPTPSGYQPDFGEAYNDENHFGWISQTDQTPLSLVGNGVDRNVVPDQRLDTNLSMQGKSPMITTPGRWEYDLPSGTYDVTVAVGDAAKTDSIDNLTVEGTLAIDHFVPTNTKKFASATVRVDVTDGRLTLDAAGGTNTKIDYANIDSIKFVPLDETPPVITITPSGTPNVDGTYASDVTEAITADDGDGTGVASISYRVDAGPFVNYGSPVVISADGPHDFTAIAVDASGNIGSLTVSFTIDRVVPYAVYSSPDVFLQTGQRLVFSTVANDPTRPARSVTVTNPSPKDLDVTGLAISGANAADFTLVSPPATPFTLAAGQSISLSAQFQPSGTGPERVASLDLASNAPLSPVTSLPLTGLDADGFEGGSEPHLREVTHMLGYATTIPLQPGQTRLPAGDEVVSPFWRAADGAAPVGLVPIARYVTRTTISAGMTGWYPKGGATQNLFDFPGGTDPYGGANQQLLPAYTGTTTFNPGGPFGLVTYGKEKSDDVYNSHDKWHQFRFFPAKAPDGSVLPHTWIVAYDRGFNIADKNFDYQDGVFLMTNAEPELDAAPAPGSAALQMGFDSTPSGSVADKDGEGTGFDTVMPNTAGDQYVPSLIDIDPTTGHLTLTSTAGTLTGFENTQQNALVKKFDATLGTWQVSTRLVGPFNNINTGQQQVALWFGTDQNNYAKIELENRNGVPTVIAFGEFDRSGKVPRKIYGGPVSDPALADAPFVDLFLTGNPADGSIAWSYRIASDDPAAIVPFGIPLIPKDPMYFFSRAAGAGLLVANKQTTVTVVGTYDHFGIS